MEMFCSFAFLSVLWLPVAKPWGRAFEIRITDPLVWVGGGNQERIVTVDLTIPKLRKMDEITPKMQ
eukprot:6137453-Amphidinium_carterae.2